MDDEKKSGWLIENDQHGPGHAWLCIEKDVYGKRVVRWTKEAWRAIRFVRHCDARNFAILHLPQDTLVLITEHSFS